MQLNTKHFGTVEIEETNIIDFTEGLPGFEDVKKFVVLGKSDDDTPFRWLQGIDNTELALVIIDPRVFKPDYIVDVEDRDIEVLEIKDVGNILIFSVVVLPEDISKMTANLRAPILINCENNTGKQVLLEKSEYQIRHYILEELQKAGG